MKKSLLAAGLFVMTAGVAQAQNTPTVITTQTLVKACTAANNSADQAFCTGFSQGVYDSYIISRHPKKSPDFICFKDKRPSRQETVANFVAWTEKNPQFAEKSAADTMLRYLAGAYPCKS